MEEYLVKKIVTNDLDESIKTYSIFDWKVTNKEINGYKTTVTFVRETDKPYYNELVKLEKKWNKETNFPAWPSYAFVLIAFLIFTAYLIVSFITNFQDKLTFFLAFMIPGLVFLFLAVVYFFIRTKKIEKIIASYYDKRHEYNLESKKIRGEE